ncbi:hypothetical protein N7454_002870 [Penicillium verhagenii]|nr:hypothetical protein N7454_002870 [Penicillium verhagenii]
MTKLSEAIAKHLTANIIPLYQGPTVKVRVEPSEAEFIISKDFLCSESPVFSAMFNGKLIESQQQTVTLEETEDVILLRSQSAFSMAIPTHYRI